MGSPVAQWVKRWPTDLADRVRSLFHAKSSKAQTEHHCIHAPNHMLAPKKGSSQKGMQLKP